MWIKRDFSRFFNDIASLPVKVLKGPRQVGKTSFLERLGTHQTVYLDDLSLRTQANENPRFFLDQMSSRIILDEAALAPALFPEIKRRVDQARRSRGSKESQEIDIWITGSNQTILQKTVRESLAGRASYFDMNTLSIHEIGESWSLTDYLFKGGWPELYVSSELSPVRYLNDFITSFVEKDIVAAAGIERKAAFAKCLQLIAGRVGQLFNAANIGAASGADTTTIQSWVSLLEDNGLLRRVAPYFTNLNKRLIKSPKIYFEDVGLATRLQGWTEAMPLIASPAAGSLIENMALSEISRFFLSRGEKPSVYFVRSKEKVEVDFLIALPNNRFIAAEVKSTPQDLSEAQVSLLETLKLNIIDRWIVSPTPAPAFRFARTVCFTDIWDELNSCY